MMMSAEDDCAVMSVLYVSRSLIDSRNRLQILDEIQIISLDRNSMLGITGLLIASPGYFAQILEGPAQGVRAVMASILADQRHAAVRIVRHTNIERASSPHWRMARFDGENFGKTIIDPLLMAAHAGDAAQAIRRLEQLIASSSTP